MAVAHNPSSRRANSSKHLPTSPKHVPDVSLNPSPNLRRIDIIRRYDGVTLHRSNYSAVLQSLIVKLDRSEERRSVILRDDWTATDVRVGDTVNVLGTFTPLTASSSSVTLSISVTSRSNLLILHPDLLLTATALANAPECRRKPLLQNLVRSSSETSPALVWGNMLHEVMQACFSADRWEKSWIDERINEVILKGLNELIKIDIGIEQATRELSTRAQGLVDFSRKYLSDIPKVFAFLCVTNTCI
jgi:DNA replication ATP-dependent helicase Dna2